MIRAHGSEQTTSSRSGKSFGICPLVPPSLMVARVHVRFDFGLLNVSGAKRIRLIETAGPSVVQRQMEQLMLKSCLAVSNEA